MEDLIKALQIFLKYKNLRWPTHCEHDVLMIMEVTEEEVSEEDKVELNKLGFYWGGECWESFKYGAA